MANNTAKGIARKCLATVAGFASLGSGLLWYASAKAQLDAASAVAGSKAAIDLTTLSLNQNLWAAFLGAGAGILIAIALFLDND